MMFNLMVDWVVVGWLVVMMMGTHNFILLYDQNVGEQCTYG